MQPHIIYIDTKTAAIAPMNPKKPIPLILTPALFAVALAEALVVAVPVDETEEAGTEELLDAAEMRPPSTSEGSLLELVPAAAER
jgi:hypothetical protein